MEQTADDSFAAAIKAKIGPVSALFKADLTLADLNPSISYTIHANAKGGAAGFGKGIAHVTLSDDGDDTLLNFAVDANVGGKLAQIGSRLIDGAARKMADDFFANFSREVSTQSTVASTDANEAEDAVDVADTGAAESMSDAVSPEGYQNSQQWIFWAIMFAILVLAVVWNL